MAGLFQDSAGIPHCNRIAIPVPVNAILFLTKRERTSPAPKITNVGPISVSKADFAGAAAM